MSGFWQNPPWRSGGGKHRMGLRPCAVQVWQPGPIELPKLQNKQQQLASRYNEVVGQLEGCDGLDDILLQQRWPSAVANEYPHQIANVAATVSPDLCVIDVLDQQRLVAACVCAPSYWRMADKLGRPLSEVHAPVEGLNQKIGERIQHFIDQAPLHRSFERYNWFLHTDDGLYQGVENSDDLTARLSSWYVRSEHQILCRLSPRYLLFAIDVQCEPLAPIEGHSSAKMGLLDALAAMDADEVSHFGGINKVQHLVSLLSSPSD